MLDGASERIRGEAIRTAVRTGRTATIGILRSPLFGSGTPLSSIFSVVYADPEDRGPGRLPAPSKAAPQPPASASASAPPAPLMPAAPAAALLPRNGVPPPSPPASASPAAPSGGAASSNRTVLGVHSTQFYWDVLLREKLPLSALALTLKISQLYNPGVDWTEFPDGGDWRAAGFERRTTHTFVNKWGNLVRTAGSTLGAHDTVLMAAGFRARSRGCCWKPPQ